MTFWGAGQVVAALGKGKTAVSNTLKSLIDRGLISRIGQGTYAVAGSKVSAPAQQRPLRRPAPPAKPEAAESGKEASEPHKAAKVINLKEAQREFGRQS